MAISSSGKTRVMVAQNFSNLLSEGYGGLSVQDEDSGPLSFDTEGAMEEEVEESPVSENVDPEVSPEETTEKGKRTLTSYVYEKLQSYGYPGRRLEQFKSEFVKENISPDGVKDIQVVIPDKKYPNEAGQTETIENEELRDISREVNQLFGLNFNGAERSKGKWTIKFTSADLSSPKEEINNDNLDEVYGKPDKTKKEPNKIRTASTINELIQETKGKIVNNLHKVIGENNDPKNVRSE